MESFQLLSVTQASKLLKVNRNYVYDLVKYGHISAIKLGSMKIPFSEVKRFVEENYGRDFSDMDNVKDMDTTKEAC